MRARTSQGERACVCAPAGGALRVLGKLTVNDRMKMRVIGKVVVRVKLMVWTKCE